MNKTILQKAIRKAGEKDCATVASIALAAYAMYLERMDRKPFPMLDDYAEHIRQGRVYLLEDGTRICGYVVLIIDADSILLDNIAVLPEDRGRGYGSRLALFAEEQGRISGCKRIRLYTNEAMVENIVWYRRLGYSPIHQCIEKGYRRIYMEKALSSGRAGT